MEITLQYKGRQFAKSIEVGTFVKEHDPDFDLLRVLVPNNRRTIAAYTNRTKHVNLDGVKVIIGNDRFKQVTFIPVAGKVDIALHGENIGFYINLNKEDCGRIQDALDSNHYMQSFHSKNPAVELIRDIASTITYHSVCSCNQTQHIRIYHYGDEDAICSTLYKYVYDKNRRKDQDTLESLLTPKQSSYMWWHYVQTTSLRVELVPDPEVNRREFFRIFTDKPNYREFAIPRTVNNTKSN